ncbi:MAG: hypothetical protein FJX54_00485 [Alphaproteobacteria bacterium]|nr:hypothetical protein [Alphaproteobacteria bacterium]
MRITLAAAAMLLAASPAWADFYILQDTATKRCTISELKAVPGTSVQVGSVYFTRAEAETAMTQMAACVTE